MEDPLWVVPKLELRKLADQFVLKGLPTEHINRLRQSLNAHPEYVMIAQHINAIHQQNKKELVGKETIPATDYFNDNRTFKTIAKDQLAITCATFLICQELQYVAEITEAKIVNQPKEEQYHPVIIQRGQPPSSTLWVTEIPASWNEKKLSELFPGAVKYSLKPMKTSDTNKKSCTIQFRSTNLAMNAKTSYDCEFKGDSRSLVVAYGYE